MTDIEPERPAIDDVERAKGIAWVDGRFVPVAEATLSPFDWGFVRSDVTYDVVHVWNGSFFRLEDHLDRFQASVAGLRMQLPVDRDALRDILIGCVRHSGLRNSYVGMVLTRGVPDPTWPKRQPSNFKGRNRLLCYALPFIWIMRQDMQQSGGVMIIADTLRIDRRSVDPTIKNYHWGDFTNALFEVEDRDADYAVLFGPDGHVAECPGSNIFVVVDGEVLSPIHGALEGITRRSVHELCDELRLPNAQRNISREELLGAQEVFMASTAGGIMPIRQIEGRTLPGNAEGTVTRRLYDAYWAKHEQGWHATPIDYADR